MSASTFNQRRFPAKFRRHCWLIAFLPLISHGQLVTEVEVKSGPTTTIFDLAHKAYVPPPVASPDWAFITLPSGLQPLQAAQNGVVLLSDNNYYYRWQNGALETLHPRFSSSSTWVNPVNGRTYKGNTTSTTAMMNSVGDIAINYYFSTSWKETGSSGTYRDTVYSLKKWKLGSTTPEVIDVPRFDYTTLTFFRTLDGYHSTNPVTLKGLDDTGSIWAEIGDRVVTILDYYGLMDQRLLTKIVRIDSAGIFWPTPFQKAGVYTILRLAGISGSGVSIGSVTEGTEGRIHKYYVGNTEVNFRPTFINKYNWLLGYTLIGSVQFVQEPDGSRPPLPTDGYVTWIDDQNRLNGVYYPDPNSYASVKVVWTKKDTDPITYDRRDYVHLQPPPPWSTNHQVAPASTSIQLGLMTRPTDTGTETRSFLAVPAAIAVDANRDGTIKLAREDATDATSATSPYRFWTNDDIDKLHTFEDSAADSMATVSEIEEDDIGPTEASQFSWQADYLDGRIESKRDLEDISRLWINTQGLNDAFKSGDLKLGLKWTDTGSTTPAIQLYESVEADGGLGYLTDDAIAADQLLLKRNAITLISTATGNAATQISGSGAFVLPTSLFANLSEAQPKTYLLFEGCTPGKGQLKLVILKLGSGGVYTEIGDGPGVWMDLKKIGDMYEHWSVGNGNGAAPDAIAARVPSSTGSSVSFSYDSGGPSPEERKYILFVHGWNMEKWEKERFAETAYKRLWWQGYKGRFGLFSWPTTNNFSGGAIQGLIDGTNFDRGEFSAWRSGAPLRQLMQTLNSAYSGKLYVFSHSMGGVVASEALRLQSDVNGGQIASVYVASQAALSVHSYDGTLSEAAGSTDAVQWHYDHPSLPGGAQDFGPQTPNIYRNWTAFVLGGSAVSTSAVGALVNFYNVNDWALAAPAWHFNQITKPDYPDPSNPFTYDYNGAPDVFDDVFRKTSSTGSIIALHLGTRAVPEDRYEIMSFAAESRVKSLGASPALSQGVSGHVDLQQLDGWDTDGGANKAHKWHSAQFRSTIIRQRDYWKTLLGQNGFNILLTPALP